MINLKEWILTLAGKPKKKKISLLKNGVQIFWLVWISNVDPKKGITVIALESLGHPPCNSRTRIFHFGGAGNDQAKKLNNKIETFKVLYKGFVECHRCGCTYMLTLGSAPSHNKFKSSKSDSKNSWVESETLLLGQLIGNRTCSKWLPPLFMEHH